MLYQTDNIPEDQRQTAQDALRIGESLSGIYGIEIEFMTAKNGDPPPGANYIKGSEYLLGCLAVKGDEPQIFINSNGKGENLFFTICHEIYHLWEFLNDVYDDHETSETNADRFAWRCIDVWRKNRRYRQPQPLLPELKIRENA